MDYLKVLRSRHYPYRNPGLGQYEVQELGALGLAMQFGYGIVRLYAFYNAAAGWYRDDKDQMAKGAKWYVGSSLVGGVAGLLLAGSVVGLGLLQQNIQQQVAEQ